MRQIVGPLVVAGLAQWMVLGWWAYVDGVPGNISLAIMFQQLFGLDPRLAWDPAQRLLAAFLDLSPGTIFLLIAGALWLWGAVGKYFGGSRRHGLRASRRPAGGLVPVTQNNERPAPSKPKWGRAVG